MTPERGGQEPVITHELEIEFRDAKILLEEGRKEELGLENRFLEMVGVFLNNVRESLAFFFFLRRWIDAQEEKLTCLGRVGMLIRNASDPY